MGSHADFLYPPYPILFLNDVILSGKKIHIYYTRDIIHPLTSLGLTVPVLKYVYILFLLEYTMQKKKCISKCSSAVSNNQTTEEQVGNVSHCSYVWLFLESAFRYQSVVLFPFTSLH